MAIRHRPKFSTMSSTSFFFNGHLMLLCLVPSWSLTTKQSRCLRQSATLPCMFWEASLFAPFGPARSRSTSLSVAVSLSASFRMCLTSRRAFVRLAQYWEHRTPTLANRSTMAMTLAASPRTSAMETTGADGDGNQRKACRAHHFNTTGPRAL